MAARRRATNAACGPAAALPVLRTLRDQCLAAVGAAARAPIDLAWAAARRAVAAAARARLEQLGAPVESALFAARIAGASATQQAAWDLLPAVGWPSDVPPPAFADLGAHYPTLLAATGRKRTGSWFTPPQLALPTAQRVLRPLCADGALPLVCDPAAGSGAFLLAALTALHEATGRPHRELALQCLLGTDLDATAASLAALALRSACGADAAPVAAFEARVRCGDGLALDPPSSCDAVLGNPPWETLQDERRQRGDLDPQHPVVRSEPRLRARFAHQGRGKLYTYRLFVERALQLLRPGGRFGLVVPASFWFDRDAAPLRRQLLDHCRFEWLYGFENQRALFAIDRRYRFGIAIAERGGRTEAVRVAFGNADADAWASGTPPHLHYRRADVTALSPHGETLLELRREPDLALLRRLHANGTPLLGQDGCCRWKQGDFNMTSDRAAFVARLAAEREGYRPHPDGTWRHPERPEALRALCQGAMLGNLDPNAGAFAGGSGRSIRWQTPQDPRSWEPQYLVAARHGTAEPARIGLRALSNASNERTAIACLLADEPCGNSLGVLSAPPQDPAPVATCAFVAGVLSSFVFDWALRLRLSGVNLNAFVLADTVLPRTDPRARAAIARLVLRCCAALPWQEGLWRAAAAEGWLPPGWTQALRAVRAADERRALRAEVDARVAAAFGLTYGELGWILRDCEHPTAALRDRAFCRGLDPRGFWRVDRELPPGQRQPQLALAAFARLGATAAAAPDVAPDAAARTGAD